MIMKMTMVSMETCYKFDIVETKDAVRNAFDNAGLVLALRQATNVVRILVDELRETRQEYKNYVAKTEQILLGIKEYRKQNNTERKKIAKDVVDYWFEKVTTPIQPVKNKTVVFFTADNELYCEPKVDHCYRVEVNSYRDKMIRTLIAQKTYVPTETLIEICGFASRKSLESAVDAMNRIAHRGLGIFKIVEGYRDSGYRIHPGIILKKE
jgi:DNA-directed RNA polymerase beta' subunit